MFNIDFVMLMLSTMIVSTKNGSVMYNILDWFSPEKEFKEHDWCQLMMDDVKSCKDDWDKSDQDEYFRGPLTYLVLLYLEATTCPGFEDTHNESPLHFWTKDRMSMRKDQEIKNGGFGLGELRELQEFHVEGDVQVEEEAVDLSKDEVEKGPVSFDTCSDEGYVASILAMCDDAENVKGKMEVAINQFITGYPKSDAVITILARYKSIFNRSAVGENGESDGFVSPTGAKSGANVSSNDVDMNEEVDGFGTPHIASTFTQIMMKSVDVLEEVMEGAYDTQKVNDIPSFSLGVTQDDSGPQNAVSDKISIMEKEAEVEDTKGKGKRKKKISKYGQSPFMNRSVNIDSWLDKRKRFYGGICHPALATPSMYTFNLDLIVNFFIYFPCFNNFRCMLGSPNQSKRQRKRQGKVLWLKRN
ncbi:hypothetical protein HanPSC8_Chr07g0304401 [Helianthus annuus]|nr:hypothetical protein HanPSC8_Chr07g0304401 [Helianthus annuus]